jgi:hypothetical protein
MNVRNSKDKFVLALDSFEDIQDFIIESVGYLFDLLLM